MLGNLSEYLPEDSREGFRRLDPLTPHPFPVGNDAVDKLDLRGLAVYAIPISLMEAAAVGIEAASVCQSGLILIPMFRLRGLRFGFGFERC